MFLLGYLNTYLPTRLLSTLHTIGFFKESETNISNEHAVIMKVKRSTWCAPIV
jgi:hypothetical protein